MRHLIRDILRRHWLGIVILTILGLPLNLLVLADRRLAFPSSLMAPFVIVLMVSTTLQTVWQRKPVQTLPVSRSRLAFSLWFTALFIVPLIGTAIGLPLFLWEQGHSWWLGQEARIPPSRVLFSLVTSISISGQVLFWCSLMPNERIIGTLPMIARFSFALLSSVGLCSILWSTTEFSTFHHLPFPLDITRALPHLLSWIAAALSYPIIRYWQFGYGFPQKRNREDALAEHLLLVVSPPVEFKGQAHPLARFSAEVAVMLFWGACAAEVAIWLWAEVETFRETGKWALPGPPYPSRFVSGPIVMCAFYIVMVALAFLFARISAFRVLRMLPISSWRLFLCVVAKAAAAFTLPFAAFLPSFVLLGVLQGDLTGVFRFFLVVYLGAIACLVLIIAVLLAHRALVWLAFIPLPFGLVFSYLGLSTPLINALHLLLFLISCALLYFTLTHSSQVYRLKAEIKE